MHNPTAMTKVPSPNLVGTFFCSTLYIINSRCVDVGYLGVLCGAAAGRAAHEHPHPAPCGRTRVGGGGDGPGGPGVALRQQNPHAVHAVAVTALEGKKSHVNDIQSSIQ